MKSDKHFHGSGKTFFTRQKSPGQSWIMLRDAAIKDRTWIINNEQGTTRTSEEGDSLGKRTSCNSPEAT
ncbi:MAG: hypothetical protein WC554_01010 [Clostridia bacterium]|jgi:hypothetical protein